MLNRTLAPLNDLENSVVAADMPRRRKDAYVLRGPAGVKLDVRLAPKRGANGSVIIDLYATNETQKAAALCTPIRQILADRKLWHHPGLSPLSMRRRVFGGVKDPFIYIKPGQAAKIGTVAAVGLSPGKHTIRIATGHIHDAWIDWSPMAYDGPSITRKVPAAWTGVLVSDELVINVPPPVHLRTVTRNQISYQ